MEGERRNCSAIEWDRSTWKYKGKLKHSVDSKKPTVVLIIYLLSESLKSDFPDKNALIIEFSFCANKFRSMERIVLKGVCQRRV